MSPRSLAHGSTCSEVELKVRQVLLLAPERTWDTVLFTEPKCHVCALDVGSHATATTGTWAVWRAAALLCGAAVSPMGCRARHIFVLVCFRDGPSMVHACAATV